jgi:hypothetical protein
LYARAELPAIAFGIQADVFSWLDDYIVELIGFPGIKYDVP